MEKPKGYPEIGQAMQWPSFKNDMSLLESGVTLGSYYSGSYGHRESDDHDHDYRDYYYSFEESKLGESSNPRLLALVEFSRELYFRRKELFKELFPHLQGRFNKALRKSGMKFWRVKSGSNRTRFTTMQRSLSLGSDPSLRDEWIKVRTVDRGGGLVEPSKKNEWIKVTTIQTGGGQQGQGGANGK